MQPYRHQVPVNVPDVESITKNEHSRRVREMFATIAARYDLLNHLLSGNVDKRWRRLVAETLYASLRRNDVRILDVACGTGDLSLALIECGQTLAAVNNSGAQQTDATVSPRPGGETQIVGLDFCRPMLEIAAAKSGKRGTTIPLIEGDALGLPFADHSFDAATIAFGLRNLSGVETGFKELLRVLKPGGLVAVLEFSRPKTPVLRSLFRVYFQKLLPFFGGLISGSRSAYEYLPDSVSRFPDQVELALIMSEAGFENVTFRNLTGGIAALHTGMRPL
jgi:demethylmenaquinone methyltransferase/2-methoxy-6-polyprenyl-1,4-benzoquinol methylase